MSGANSQGCIAGKPSSNSVKMESIGLRYVESGKVLAHLRASQNVAGQVFENFSRMHKTKIEAAYNYIFISEGDVLLPFNYTALLIETLKNEECVVASLPSSGESLQIPPFPPESSKVGAPCSGVGAPGFHLVAMKVKHWYHFFGKVGTRRDYVTY